MLGPLPSIRVVFAIIEEQGRFLITQRQSSASFPGLWEFPSGRVEEGEADDVALKRELLERIGIAVAIERQSATRSHLYKTYVVDSVLYHAKILPGHSPRPLRVADFRWVTAQEIDQYAFPPADQATMDELWGIGHGNHSSLQLPSAGANGHAQQGGNL
jgi:8-oxo-dGTP diphosphatase